MKSFGIKQLLVLAILIGTLGFFGYYFAKHPDVGHTLAQTSPAALVVIIVLYVLSIVAIAFITFATLMLCRVSIGKSESIKLTAYSSLVNFFGPLQSGPAFRAIYLKKKHGVSLKKYAAASLVYYFAYGAINCLFVASYWLDWRLGALLLLGLIFLFLIIKTNKISSKLKILNIKGWYYLVLATLFQVAIMAAIYSTELHATSPDTSLHQAIIYTGAANLALFVSLTPGAIGFRESFLVFSQNLHHISSETIITTNILDRAMYIALLSILALVIFVTHTKSALTSGLADDKSK